MIETLCYGTIYKKLSNSFNIGRLNSTNMSSNGIRFALRPNCHWQKIWFWNTSNHLKRQPLYSGLWANVLIYSQSNDMNNSFLG